MASADRASAGVRRRFFARLRGGAPSDAGLFLRCPGRSVCLLPYFLLRIRPLIDAYTIHSTGITLSRLRLYPDSFLSLYFIVPPITEQKEIADYLDTKCAEIDRLIAKKEQLVKELESYKKSLIYEVVTGKREV